ncbi:MAG TPA: GNAT family N-acetyltransferase [Sphingomicrobium sp.]|nr:GNAT family N-acetyltransferase [Sphingomicrobium sp.]
MITDAPTLETERLILRAWGKRDFRPWETILSEPAVARFLSGSGQTPEDVWRRLAGAVGSWPLLGFGGWAVVLKQDDSLIGNVGLFNAWRDLEPEFGEEPEMGWIFASRSHGQGYASEACQKALDWAESHLQPTPIWAIIAPENESSLRLADKLGFEKVSETTYNGDPTAVLKRPAWG